jgi:hypothetical protein
VYNENEIVVDGADRPGYTVLQPYDPQRRFFHRALVVIRNYGLKRKGPMAKLPESETSLEAPAKKGSFSRWLLRVPYWANR